MPAPTTSAFTMEELMWHYEQLQGQAPAALYANDPAILEELRCGYSSKRCENVRTTKKGGGLHRFCEFHRRRANKNQWRVDNKRRMLRTQHSGGDQHSEASETSAIAPSVSSTVAGKPYSPRASPRVAKKEKRAEEALKSKLPDPVKRSDDEVDDNDWLSDSDIAMLQCILFDETELKLVDNGFISMLEEAQKEPAVGSPTAVYDLHHIKREWVV